MAIPKFRSAMAMAKVPPGFSIKLAGHKDDKPEMPSLKLPDGFDAQGKKPGDKIQIVVEGTLGDDGSLMVESVNGIPMDGDKEPDAEDQGAFEGKEPEGADGMTHGDDMEAM